MCVLDRSRWLRCSGSLWSLVYIQPAGNPSCYPPPSLPSSHESQCLHLPFTWTRYHANQLWPACCPPAVRGCCQWRTRIEQTSRIDFQRRAVTSLHVCIMDPSWISFSGRMMTLVILSFFRIRKTNSAKGKEGLCLFNVLMCIRLERLSN